MRFPKKPRVFFLSRKYLIIIPMPIKNQLFLALAAVAFIPTLLFVLSIYFHVRQETDLISRPDAYQNLPRLTRINEQLNQYLVFSGLVSLCLTAVIVPLTSWSISSKISTLDKKYRDQTFKMSGIIDEEKRKEAKDQALLNSIGEGIVVTDKNGNIELINQAAENMVGWKMSEIVGRKWYEIAPLLDEMGAPIPSEKRATQRVFLEGKTISNAKYYYVRRDKSVFPVATTAAPVILGGKTIGVIAVFRDITHEKDVDKAKSEFVSLASHQLRTPLSAIKWFAEMLSNGDAGPLNVAQLEYVSNIYNSNERLIDMVNGLLNITRVESGRIIIDPVPTDLKELVNQVTADLQKKIHERHQKLVISVNPDLPKIKIDPKLISQVYLNLISNAIKYTPENGEVSIFISRSETEIISQVNDSGYGIPKDQQQKIFQKFYRASNAVKFEPDGTGLGLYLARAIVESSGGKIWFTSEENRGATFWFSLPLTGTQAKKGEVSIS